MNTIKSPNAKRTTVWSLNKTTQFTSTYQILHAVDWVYQQVIGIRDNEVIPANEEMLQQLQQQQQGVRDSNVNENNHNVLVGTAATNSLSSSLLVPTMIIVIDWRMMIFLKTAISSRRYVMKINHSDGDVGHRNNFKSCYFQRNTHSYIKSIWFIVDCK
jgi:hypothetical protein